MPDAVNIRLTWSSTLVERSDRVIQPFDCPTNVTSRIVQLQKLFLDHRPTHSTGWTKAVLTAKDRRAPAQGAGNFVFPVKISKERRISSVHCIIVVLGNCIEACLLRYFFAIRTSCAVARSL